MTLLVICAKLVTGWQAVGLAHLVVRADAVVAGPLDVAGDQVLAVVLQAAVGEQQVADVADRHQIVGLRDAVGVALENGADVGGDVAGERIQDAAWVEDVRVEEVGGQADVRAGRVVGQHVLAVVALPLDLAAQQAVAEPEGHGGELGGDRGIDVRVVAGVRAGRALGPSRSGRYWV